MNVHRISIYLDGNILNSPFFVGDFLYLSEAPMFIPENINF